MAKTVSIANLMLILAYFGLVGIGGELSATDLLFAVTIVAVSAVGGTLAVRNGKLQAAALFALTAVAFVLTVLLEKLTQEPWTGLVGGL
jgi:hypothetical protein